MPEPYTTQRMLSLRKLTRAAADQMRHQLKDILSAVGPLLQPKAALGDYVRGVKEPVRGADALFKEIESMYHDRRGREALRCAPRAHAASRF